MTRVLTSWWNKCRRRPYWSLVAVAGLGALLLHFARLTLSEHYLQSAQLALQEHDLRSALRELQHSLRFQKSNPQARLLAAQTARRLDRFAEANQHLDEYERIRKADRDSDREWLLQGVQQGDIAGQQEHLRSLIELDANAAPLIYEALAKGYMNALLRPEMMGCVSEALEKWPAHAPLRVLRGIGWQELHEDDHALADFQQALHDAPRYSQARLCLANLQQQLGFNREAIRNFEILLQEGDDKPEVLLGLARCRFDNHELDSAQSLLSALNAKHPTFVPGLIESGRFAMHRRQAAEAQTLLSKATALAPRNQEACRLTQAHFASLAWSDKIAETQRQIDEITARELQLVHLHALLRESPRDAARRYAIGMWCLENDEEQAGLRWFYSSLLMNEHYGPSHEQLAKHYERTGQPRWAARHRRLALNTSTPFQR